LLDAQTLGCPGQMQFFRDCDEVAQQSEIQGHLLFVFFWFGLSGRQHLHPHPAHLRPARLAMCRRPSANEVRRATFAPARNRPLAAV